MSLFMVPPCPLARSSSKPSGISTAARISFSTIWFFQSGIVGTTLIFGYFRKAVTTSGESVPPTIITFGFSFFALPITPAMTAVNPAPMTGIISSGTRNVVISVRRSRSASVSSLRYTIQMFRSRMSDRLWRVVWCDNLHEHFFKIILSVPLPQLLERSLRQQSSALNNSHDVAQFFHFAHHVRRENHCFAAVPALTDEFNDRPRCHDIQTKRRLIENHHGRIVHQRAGDGGLLFHSSGKLVATPVAKIVHVQPVKDFINALFQCRGIKPI